MRLHHLQEAIISGTPEPAMIEVPKPKVDMAQAEAVKPDVFSAALLVEDLIENTGRGENGVRNAQSPMYVTARGGWR